ncbi:glycoside hydrolase family 3 protein [Saccharopolyspora montiporae]|nr:glycoside hydrolase family 3 protein [Saccharopolyspora sp. HNM0983]
MPDTDEAQLQAQVAKLTLADKARLLTGADFWTLHPEPEIGLSSLVLSDGPNGVRGTAWDERDPSLLFPVGAALAATWDRSAARTAGEWFGEEARRRGVHVVLGPTVNLQRSPFGGRNFENFSEDPQLVAEIGAEVVRGIQSRDVAATPKHFVANDSETDRFTYDVVLDEPVLREFYLEPFRSIVQQAGPWALMAAYNSVAGQTMTENRRLNNELLKAEWGWDGLLMSDWFAARSVDATALGGLDLVMPGPGGPWSGGELEKAVQDGRVPEDVLDDKVLRLLRLASRTGALGGRVHPTGEGPSEQARPVIRRVAAEGFVLLRNEPAGERPVLPLPADELTKVAVIGENAVLPALQGGGSSRVSPAHAVTPLDGLRAALPGADVVHRRGVRHRRLLDALPREQVIDPDGEGTGFRVEFLDEAGQVLSRELRGTDRLLWIGGTGIPAGTRTVRVRGQLAAEAGEHVFAVNGTGRFEVQLSGREVLDEELASDENASDPLADLIAPPERRFDVVLVDTDLDEQGHAPLSVLFTPPDTSGLVNVGIGHRAQEWDDASELSAALAAAREADVAVVVVGTNDEVETEGRDRGSLDLPGAQDALVSAVAEVNSRTVVVVNAGSPVLMPWRDEVPAVLWTWFGSQEYGDALADVLLGSAEPGGRLPETFPAELADVPVPLPALQPVDGALHYSEGALLGYRAYAAEGVLPAFGFGHGLGYTAWEYLAAQDEGDAVRVTLRNIGERRGREVVQVYGDPVRLAGFGTAEAEAGEQVEVRIELLHRPDGPLSVGASAQDLRLAAEPAR